MSERARRSVLVTAMIALLAVALAWSFGWYAQAKRRAQTVAAETARCHDLAAQIESARQRPVVEQTDQPVDLMMLQLVVDASHRTGLDPEHQVLNVQTQADRPMQGSAYHAGVTELHVSDVSRRQLASFVHELLAQQPGLHVDRMQLSFDEGRVTVNPMVLTYLVR